MATRASILRRSKRAENRVAKAIFGAEARRDWKDDHDLSGYDAEGDLWIGEVKSLTWPAGPGRLWAILLAALEQAERHGNRAFAVLAPPKCEPENALVMVRRCGAPVVMPLRQFRDGIIGANGGGEDAQA